MDSYIPRYGRRNKSLVIKDKMCLSYFNNLHAGLIPTDKATDSLVDAAKVLGVNVKSIYDGSLRQFTVMHRKNSRRYFSYTLLKRRFNLIENHLKMVERLMVFVEFIAEFNNSTKTDTIKSIGYAKYPKIFMQYKNLKNPLHPQKCINYLISGKKIFSQLTVKYKKEYELFKEIYPEFNYLSKSKFTRT